MNNRRLYAVRRLIALSVSITSQDHAMTKKMSISELTFWEGIESLIESRFDTFRYRTEIQTFEERDDVIREFMRVMQISELPTGIRGPRK